MDDLTRCREQNRLLRDMVRSMAQLMKELYVHIPLESRQLPQVERARQMSEQVMSFTRELNSDHASDA